MLRRFLQRMDEKISIQVMVKLILFFLLLLLLQLTSSIWGHWLSIAKSIFTPFLLGFLIAYIVDPLISHWEKRRIHRNLAILLFWAIIIILLFLLGLVLLPLLYDKISGFIGNLTQGVEWISEKIIHYGEYDHFDLLDRITDSIISFLNAYDTWLPNIMSSLPGFMNSFLNVITNLSFTLIVAIYMMSDFDRIKGYIRRFGEMFYQNAGIYLKRVDEDVSVYLKSMLILMAIKLCEYSLFYFLIGHEDWLIIGILCSLGQLIPYLGGTVANSIGVLTALSLSPIRIVFLLVGICILSNMDAYVISPLIHEKRSSLGPLVTLLVIFGGGVIYGAIGVMFSVPLAIAIRALGEAYKEDPRHQVNAAKYDETKQV